MNILIADDNLHMRRIVLGMIEAHGWKVCAEAKDGVQAVARAKECKPDVVVLDLAMSEMNGIEAARRIQECLPGVPIIMLTLYAVPLVEAEARKVGIRKVISKLEATTLAPAIEEAYTQRSGLAAQ